MYEMDYTCTRGKQPGSRGWERAAGAEVEEPVMIAADPKTRQVMTVARQVADNDSSVILYGESGTGKDVMARYIYRNSARRDAPFLPINCAAIPSELMESEFFGYEKGSFTGASREGKAGLFEKADGGTLFLDEVGELPLAMQTKLLRVLENGEVRRVGGSRPLRTDVRILAATNRNLKQMVAEKSFREDLYYRLNVIPICIRPLRERPADIEALALHFLQRHAARVGRQSSLTPDAMDLLKRYQWPGNIRELKNIMERAVVMAQSPCIDSLFLEQIFNYEHLSAQPAAQPAAPAREWEREEDEWEEPDHTGSLRSAVASFEQDYIKKVLKRYKGNVSKAAACLQISRSGLYKKLEKSV